MRLLASKSTWMFLEPCLSFTLQVRVVKGIKSIQDSQHLEVGFAKLLLQWTGPLPLFFLKPGEQLKKMLPDFFKSKRSTLHV